MKNIILIDGKDCLITWKENTFEESFKDMIKIIKEELKYEYIENMNLEEIMEDLKNTCGTDVDETKLNFALIFSRIFQKFDLEDLQNLIKSNLGLKKTEKSILALKIDNFCYADYHYLRLHFDICLFFFTENNLENFFLKFIITNNDILPIESLKIFSTKKDNKLLSLLTLENLFIISWRPDFIKKEILDKNENLKKFVFRTNFISYLNKLIPSEGQREINETIKELEIEWDLLILKGIFNKMKIILDFNNKRIERKNIIKVGVNYNLRVFNLDYKSKFFVDNFPIVFCHYDPMSNLDKDIDVIMINFSNIITYYKLDNDKKTEETINFINKKIEIQEKKYNKKILVTNKFAKLFFDRYEMYTFFKNLFSSENFKKNLSKNFPEKSFKFPKTALIPELNTFEETEEKIKNFNYPLIIKSIYCTRSLSKYSHEMIIIKSKPALKKLITEKSHNITNFLPIIIQEIIYPSENVHKIYSAYNKTICQSFNSIDLEEYKEIENIKGSLKLKNFLVKEIVGIEDRKAYEFVVGELRKNGLFNFGIDFLKKGNFYFAIDVNPDNFSWPRNLDKNEQLSYYHKALRSIVKGINK